MPFGDYDTLMIYQLLVKKLFFPITHEHFNILFPFLENGSCHERLDLTHSICGRLRIDSSQGCCLTNISGAQKGKSQS